MPRRPYLHSAQSWDHTLGRLPRSLLSFAEEHKGHWLSSLRHITGQTMLDVAPRLGVKQPALTRIEKAERDGTLTLGKLRQAAEAMECDLVYFLVPRRSLATIGQEVLDQFNAQRRARHTRPARAYPEKPGEFFA